MFSHYYRKLVTVLDVAAVSLCILKHELLEPKVLLDVEKVYTPGISAVHSPKHGKKSVCATNIYYLTKAYIMYMAQEALLV